MSEAHVAGWNSICEMTRQLRGSAGASQIADAKALQWGTAWGDSRDPDEGRMSMHEKPRPRIGPDNAPFWQGCRAHRLMLPTCTACGKAHLPPGPVCPFCFADAIEWKQASGRGVISTWTAVHKAWFPAFAAETPYNVIQVELEEGPRLTSNLLGADKPSIGQRVEVVFEDVDAELTLPRFRAVWRQHGNQGA